MHARTPAVLALSALALSLGACQQGAQPSPTVLHLTPAAARAAPGEQVRFSVTSPPGISASDVSWSVDPATCGTVDASGLFTAAPVAPGPQGMCTVVATLRSDPARVGMAVVVVEVGVPSDRVAASGQRQSADGVVVESVLLEPVSATASRDASGAIENRSGFYPSGTVGP